MAATNVINDEGLKEVVLYKDETGNHGKVIYVQPRCNWWMVGGDSGHTIWTEWESWIW